VGAAVTNDRGELLLIQRADSGVWLYPTGWCDVGYSAPEVVVKEVLEETGIEAEPVRLIGVLDGMRLGSSRIPLYSLLFFCRAVGGEIKIHPLECTDAGWFTRDNLPSPIIGAERWAGPIFAAIDGEHRDVFYDDLRRPVWRGEP
jgi:ADP-ribose pyrophosphatase YjhB (NUDIX family)